VTSEEPTDPTRGHGGSTHGTRDQQPADEGAERRRLLTAGPEQRLRRREDHPEDHDAEAEGTSA
jgi:hypothetical protein